MYVTTLVIYRLVSPKGSEIDYIGGSYPIKVGSNGTYTLNEVTRLVVLNYVLEGLIRVATSKVLKSLPSIVYRYNYL
jgi:hypothetical protein